MKTSFSLITFLFLSAAINAQTDEVGDIVNIWSFPEVYAYDEEVSWYFDLSATGFQEDEDVYIWIWSPSEPDAGNWENSSEFAKLNYEGNFIWKFTLTPTVYFSMTPEDIAASAGFWLRLKDKTGTKMTTVTNVAYTDFSEFYTANEIMRAYPTMPVLDQPLSILFNSNLAENFDGATSVHMHSGLNSWQILQEYQPWVPEVLEKTKLRDLGNGFYKMDLIPIQYFDNVPQDFELENINFLFVKDDWVATSPEFILFADEVTPPPPPVFSYFPLKISHQDLLGITRVNNELGINRLDYTITADDLIIEGQFEGNTVRITGFIDLVTPLKDKPELQSIHLLVKDNNGTVVHESEIPLITED